MTKDNKADGVAVSAPDRIWADTESMGWVEANDRDAMRPTESEYIRADLLPQWQPIGTAPKDGSFIIGHGDGVAIENCPYIMEWSEGDGWVEAYSEVDVTPTHWMPLPTPPVQP